MVRLTNHDRLQCREPDPLRKGHPTDEQLDDLAERMLKRQRGYTQGGVLPTDPGLVRLRIQLRAERDVARFLLAAYRPTVDHHSQHARIVTRHGVPVAVVCRRRRVDPKGRASMPELLVPTEWKLEPRVAVAFAVWVEDGCAPYLAGWLWADELRRGPGTIIGSRVFHRRPVGQLHDMQRLVTASPYVETRQPALMEVPW